MTFTTNGNPAATITQSAALPSGVTFDENSGTLSGTPAAGTYKLKFTASNGVGKTATFSGTKLVLIVTPQ